MKQNIIVKVNVTNTGKVSGKEVIQLYISAPNSKIGKPVEELKAFAKTQLLQPGQSTVISFTLTPTDLASFVTNQAAWIADAGTYTVKVGNSSTNILQTATFQLPQQVITENVKHLMVPQQPINELGMK
jgi:beta-glucosidase